MIRGVLRLFLIATAILLTIQVFPKKSAKKTLHAERIQQKPKIDGILNEAIWDKAVPATDFMQNEPYNGSPSVLNSEVKVLYDDDAVYIGAYLYDVSPDSIYNELSKRDDLGISDFFGVHIDTYNDALNSFGFFVNPAGVQRDVKVAERRWRDDASWDAVWESKTNIFEDGWVVEIRIPYSELRFANKKVQTWGINFIREIRRYREYSTWNFIDKEIFGIKTQAGVLEGIENVTPPLRLSAVPYMSGITQHSGETGEWLSSYSYGMDVKVGLSESFTLDVTLIPDFSQVQSDDRIVDLSPFETFYREQRPFFTEGTELFDRNDRVFYSRRVGKRPINYYDVSGNYSQDSIIENPSETSLINATKISGKTKSGLGIGVFNAMTSQTNARVINEEGIEEEVMTQAFSNYNMLVFDQSLKNNSFIALYNTNVYRGKDEYMANVTGTEIKFDDKKNKYSVSGNFHFSQKYYPNADDEFGHSYRLSLGKIDGKFRYNYTQSAMSDKYDHNDLGFMRRNNWIEHSVELSYNEFEPFGKILRSFNSIEIEYERLYSPKKFSSLEISGRTRNTFINYLSLNGGFRLEPIGADDHYEARQDGWVYKRPASYQAYLGLSPDYRKDFVTDLFASYTLYSESGRSDIRLRAGQRIRFNNQFNFRLNVEYQKNNHDYGYVSDSINAFNDQQIILFGQRDVKTVTNTIETNYIFTNTSSLSLRMRHYWIRANYLNYYNLGLDGQLYSSDFKENNDFNINVFNIDLVYQWDFAPGSELLLVYKNMINADVDINVDSYFGNLGRMFKEPSYNSFSIKLLYYIDYQSLRKKNRRG